MRKRLAALAGDRLRDRRGAVAAIFAVSSTVLMGMVALAGDAGVWQLQLRNARTAADLAALSGALAIERNGNARGVATSAVSQNGFISGGDNGRTTVTASVPPASGTYAGCSDAVEVVVTRAQNLGLAKLALGGGLSLGGSSTTNAQRCGLAAKSTQYGINIFGSARVRASDLVTTGACGGCASGDVARLVE